MQVPKLTQKQKDLASQLSRYNHKIETSYLGSVFAIQQNEYPDRLVHHSHSLRQVIDLLARNNQKGEEVNRPLDRKERKRLLQSIIDPLGQQSYAFDDDYVTLVTEHNTLSSIAHGKENISNDHAVGKLSVIEDILHAFTRPQVAINEEIDEIISQEPSKENAEKLKKLQFRWATQSQLIEKLSSDWLPFLTDVGFFDNPQPATGSVESPRYLVWMASKYLTKCTTDFPEEITALILSCKFNTEQERNPAVYSDFLTCAVELPLQNVKKIAQKALGEKWHDFVKNHWLTENYVEIIEMLYLNGEDELAIQLARSIFTPVLSEPRYNYSMIEETKEYREVQAPFELYWFEQILQDKISKLVEKNSIPITSLLIDLLEESIQLDNEGKGLTDQYEDGLLVWRSAIEDSDQNGYSNIKSIFVMHLRNCLLHIGIESEEKLKKMMSKIKSKTYWIYRRMELYVYTQFPHMFKQEIEESLVQYFAESHTHHEYYNLIKRTFENVSDPIQQKIFELIDTGLDNETFAEIKNRSTEEIAKNREKYWTLEHLEPIKEHLDDNHQRTYDELVKEFGHPEHPDYLTYHTTTMGESPIDSAVFAGNMVDEVFEIVKKHVPEGEFSFEDKIIRTFREFVENNALECSKKSLELKDIENGIQYELFSGLRNALEKNKSVSWKDVLSLIEYIISSIHKNKSYVSKSYDHISAIYSLLENGFKKDSIDFEFKDRLWNTLKLMIDIGTQHHELDEKYPDNQTDPLTMSINNVGGQSFHVIYQYAVWCEKHSTTKRFLEPNVKQVFNDYLDQKLGSHTISRHAVLGVYLPNFYYLDQDWTKTIPARVISGRNARIAFWEGYVNWNTLYRYVYADLFSWYDQFLNKDFVKNMERKQTYESTINHSLLAYFYDLENTDDFFEKFLDNASDDAIKHCVFQAGIIMDGKNDEPQFNKEKLIKLWQHPVLIKQDLDRWFRDSPLGRKDTIVLYTNYLKEHPNKINLSYASLKELNSYLNDFPQNVVDCIEMLVDKQEHNYVPEKEMKPMVKSLLEKNGKEIDTKCKSIIEKVATLGYDWKDLLK